MAEDKKEMVGRCSSSLHARMQKLLTSVEWSDCGFALGDTHFKAHRLILGSASPVFEAMLYGPLATAGEILVPDISPHTFRLLLTYVYTDTVPIDSIDEAFDLIYASRKYLLEHLTSLCVEYVTRHISIDNVLAVLHTPHYMNDDQILSEAMQLFRKHAQYLMTDNLASISLPCLKSILESSNINIKEKDLVKLVFEWTLHYCEQNVLPLTIQSRKNVLEENGIFDLLRLKTLSGKDLDEIIGDVNCLLLPSELQSKLSAQRAVSRGPVPLSWALCQRYPLRSAPPVLIDPNNNTLTTRLKCNKSVFVSSLCIPTRMTHVITFSQLRAGTPKLYSEQISVTFTGESDDSVTEYDFMTTVEYDSNTDIELSEPCLMKKDLWYKVTFVWPANMSHSARYLVECREKLYRDRRVCIEFDDETRPGSAGSFLAGLRINL